MNTESISELPKCFSLTIGHKHFNAALGRLRELVRQKSSIRIIIVTGPTGAGKTTLRNEFASELEAIAAPHIANNAEMIAYGGCAIKARGSAAVSWKDTYIQTLHSLQHPFAGERSLGRNPVDADSSRQVLKGISPDALRRLSSDHLFRIVQKTITHRKPMAILFDEAHHFLQTGSALSLREQLDHIKFIADETQTLFVLFGTYELIKLMDLSGALIRRREVVHLSRYVYDPKNSKESLRTFAESVVPFAKQLSDRSEVEFLKEVPYLYQGSLGCVGIMRDWIYRAYTKAAESRGGKITMKLLKETELIAKDRDELLTEALDGEKYFAERTQVEEKYLARLGFGNSKVSPNAATAGVATNSSAKPFERNPHNDPTGLGLLDPKKENAA